MKRIATLLAVMAAVLAAGPIRFAVIGDRTGDAQDSVYERIVTQVAQAKPEFVLTVGDQVEGYTTDTAELAAQWAEYRGIVAGLGAPLHLAAGNHDITYDPARPVFERHWGRPYYSFEHKGIRVFVLDNAQANTVDEMGDEQLAWFASALDSFRSARWTMVLMHKPFWEQLALRGKPDTLHALYKRFGVDAVFTGHYHQYFAGTIDGIRYTSVGSSGGDAYPSPTGLGYHWIEVAVDRRRITITPVREDGTRRNWQDVSLEEKLALDRVEALGLRFSEPLEIVDGQAGTTVLPLVVSNFGNPPVSDSLGWEVPDGWQVSTAGRPDFADGGDAALVDVVVTRGADVYYPVPVVSTTLPYAPGKGVRVSQSLRVARTAAARHGRPDIDGELREKLWWKPATKLFGPDGKPSLAESTAFYFAWDDSSVYLAAWCRETQMDSLRLGATGRDGSVYNDDCVGWFLRPDFASRRACQVYVNASGVVFDQSVATTAEGGMESDPKWSGEYEVKTARGKDWWSVEMRVPVAQLGGKTGQGISWGVNFRRKQQRLGNADWQVPISYDVDTFGRMVME